ncbi:hypothetical protein GCM10011297_14860 [Bacterioplanes sanyensis]|jgi:hypothetical protein|uniref:hypothetical protein n=1 Tax=Bacterioplanes sanyensis TaxID=1249553 RepID=UPI001674656D|nr:hypothetical protein [Bacterioplanes sanyensis]GGY42865.1 hypothetical protein GCM10011297_14860 [Bacterioplanes sanyensis]
MEDTGEIIIKAPSEWLETFKTQPIWGLSKLAEHAGVPTIWVDELLIDVDSIEQHGDYLKLGYENPEGVAASRDFIRHAQGIEYYACHWGDYGTDSFFVLNDQGVRYDFYLEECSDEMEYEHNVEAKRCEIEKWKAAIPQALLEHWPSYTDIDLDDYL